MGSGTSIVALNSSASGALSITGSATITVPGAVYVDSTSTSAIKASGSAGLDSPSVNVVGGVSNSSSATDTNLDTGDPNLHTGATAVGDPLAGIAAPSVPTTEINPGSAGPYKPTGGTSSSSPITLSPGKYNGGITLSNQFVLLRSGTYYLTGPLTLNGSGVLVSGTQMGTYDSGTKTSTPPPDSTRTNVMFYVTPSGTQGVTASGWVVQLWPPASGTYQGISIFQDRNSTAKISISNMKPTTDIEGTIYAKQSDMTLTGGSNLIVGSSFISDTLGLSGSSSFTIPPPKIPTPGLSKRDIRLED
jgi:hypothetical protein